MEGDLLYKDLSYKIVGLASEVHRELGFGFLEKVYENALMVLFQENGIRHSNSFRYLFHFMDRSWANMSLILSSRIRSSLNLRHLIEFQRSIRRKP